MNQTRILIADRRRKTRFALRTLLGRQPGLEISGEAADALELWGQIETDCPDAVLLDWWLDGSTTADLLKALRRNCPGVYIVVLSGLPEARRAALASGADAFVSKVDPPEQLLATIRSVQRVEAALTMLARTLQGVGA
jgi:DNA-binding NarL/FixJ family response regulator